MHLSCLLIDVGENPDRPRPGRLWLRNLYHVHQRLCMAFPSAARKFDDPDFLAPFRPDDFGTAEPKQVHVDRRTKAGFLFRIDPKPPGRAVIIVQSVVKPDWDYAFHNADYLLVAPPDMKPLDLRFAKGQRLRFRLVANPTKKMRNFSREEQLALKEEFRNKKGRHGKRVPIPSDQLYEWLAHRAEPGGFFVEKEPTAVQPGYVYVNKTRESGGGQSLRSVRYDGILAVTDAAEFPKTIVRGIGPAKAFGFGLLSIASAESTP